MEKSIIQGWLKQLSEGDSSAYERIFKAFYPSVYRSALRITKDATIANDACQEVFLELWKNRAKINVTTSLKSYLHRGAVNRSLNIIKSRNRHAGQNLEHVAEPVNKAATPSEVAEYKELEEYIQEAIHHLPERCRQVFVLSRFEGKKYKEIAQLLGISVKTVENQMLKALKVLRKAVKDYKSDNQHSTR